MSKFNNLYKLIFEELTAAQKTLTDTYTAKRNNNLSFGPFKNERTYFNLPKHKAADIMPSSDITAALDQIGYYITDYRNGTAVKKQIEGQKPDLRQVKIGKLLNKINEPLLKKEFDERLAGNIRNVEEKELSICITYNPYDIAGMSTGRNWTSCMELDKGAYRETPLLEVQYGGMCAYLIDSDDKNIEHPYARIAIKRLIDQISRKYFIFVQESIIYGDTEFAKEMNFAENVKIILDKVNQYTSGNAIEFMRADGEHKAYSDAALNRLLYIKNFETLDQALENGQQYSDEDWLEISKNPNIPDWFKEKYSNKLSI